MQVNDVVEIASLVSNHHCNHVGLRSFAFKDGQQIKCCPICTLFDEHRRAVLAGAKRKVKGKTFVTTFPEEPVLTLYGGSND